MAKPMMTKLRLRFVGVADFRKNEATMLEDLIKEKSLRLRARDVVMFRSGSGDQILFVHRRETVDAAYRGITRERDIIASRRLRVSWGTWSELMVADYAMMVGIVLENLETMEQFFARILGKKKQRST